MSSATHETTLPARFAPAVAPPRDRNGVGRLRFSRVASKTTLTQAYASSPLKFLNPRSHGHAAWVYTSTYGGGLVGGDVIRLNIDVEAGAAAFLTTQASTKIYRSAAGASQFVTARVADGGLLALVPDPVVLFAGSAFTQEQLFDLEAGATLVFVDALLAGRVAAGERWAFDRYRTTLRIRRNGALVLHDAVRLDPEEGNLLARVGRFNVLLVAVLMGPAVRDCTAGMLRRAAPPVTRRPRLVSTCAPLGHDGVLVRIAGESSEDVIRAMRTELSCLETLLGADPWSRKW